MALLWGILIAASTALSAPVGATGGNVIAGAPLPRSCALEPFDRWWIEHALVSWKRFAAPALRLEPASVPMLIFYDSTCEYRLVSASDSGSRVNTVFTAQPHRGDIQLPNGTHAQPIAIAFTSQTKESGAPFIVMALSAVWRHNTAWSQESDWPLFLRRSLVHELTHARQLEFFEDRIEDLAAQVRLKTMDDDIVQTEFGDSDRFKTSVRREIALLYAAAVARDTVEGQRLAREAIRLIQVRRAIHFAGELAPWATLEQAFLDIEGIAQWAALAAVRGELDLSTRYAIRSVRDVDYWSQDEGLALYLVLDAFVPEWQRRMFTPDAPTSIALIQQALGDSAGATRAARTAVARDIAASPRAP
jgi:hypothetical protein